MRACLEIEAFGDNETQFLRLSRAKIESVTPGLGDMVVGKIPTGYWVAEIIGMDPQYKWWRRFLTGKKDYSRVNGTGSRGLMVHYLLESGRVYEVKHRVSWRRSERYFCRVTEIGDIVRIDECEVTQWLPKASDSSGSTS